MNFLWGYLIARALSGPRRKAAPGSALPLYGGMLTIVAGVMVAYWNGPDAVDGRGWLLAGFGLLSFVIGACMQGGGGYRDPSFVPPPRPYRSNGDNLLAAFGMSLLTLCVLIAVVVVAIGFTKHGTLLPAPALIQQINAQSPATAMSGFQSGVAARQEWESWFSGQNGDYRAGAEYWASERSKLKPGSCRAADGASRGPFTEGCEAAQQMLATSDFRRRSDPEFRRGWNSPPVGN